MKTKLSTFKSKNYRSLLSSISYKVKYIAILGVISIFYSLSANAQCTPSGTNNGFYISNFSTLSGIQNISNLGSGASLNSYGNFYSTHSVSQVAGSSFSFNSTMAGVI